MSVQLLRIFLIFFLALLPRMAHANFGGLFVEPAVTYDSSIIKVSNPGFTGGTSEEKITGLGLGVRLGFHIYDIIFVGAMPALQNHATNPAHWVEAPTQRPPTWV